MCVNYGLYAYQEDNYIRSIVNKIKMLRGTIVLDYGLILNIQKNFILMVGWHSCQCLRLSS